MILRPFEGMRTKKTYLEKQKLIEKGTDIFTVRLNEEERKMIDEARKILVVDRDSTALKELAEIGYNVLQGFLLGKIVKKIVVRLRRGYADTISEYNEENIEK